MTEPRSGVVYWLFQYCCYQFHCPCAVQIKSHPMSMSSQSTPGASVVATGSDDGYVGVWDRRVKDVTAGANVVLLRPAHAQTGGGKEGPPGGRGSKPDIAECVTSLEVSIVVS